MAFKNRDLSRWLTEHGIPEPAAYESTDRPRHLWAERLAAMRYTPVLWIQCPDGRPFKAFMGSVRRSANLIEDRSNARFGVHRLRERDRTGLDWLYVVRLR